MLPLILLAMLVLAFGCGTAPSGPSTTPHLDGTWNASTTSDTNRAWTATLKIASGRVRGTIRCDPFPDLSVAGDVEASDTLSFTVNEGKRWVPGMAEYHVTGRFPSLQIANPTGGRCGRATLNFVSEARRAAPSAAATPRAERPTYALGQKWIRNDGVWELTRIEEDRYVFAGTTAGSEIHLSRNLGLARSSRGIHHWTFEPVPEPAWPLEVGKSGSTTGAWLSPLGGMRHQTKFTWSVDAYEDVSIAGAALKAFRISLLIQPPLGGRWTLTTWYAPEVRQLVKATGHDMGQLNFHVVAFDLSEPVKIALDRPADQSRTMDAGTVVAGSAASERGLARLVVSVNGVETARRDESPPTSEVAFEIPVALEVGRNVVLVTAHDALGGTTQEARILFRDRPAIPPTPAGVAPLAAPGPPQFRLVVASPADQSRIERENVTLVGHVGGGRGVSRVVVTLDGIEVKRLEPPALARTLVLEVPLKLREGANTLVVTATEGDEAIHQEVRIVHHERSTPVAIAFRYPEDRLRVTEPVSVVAAVVTSSRGVGGIVVTLNGVEVHRQSERTPPKSVLVTVPLTLREGPNAIGITATEPDGAVRQEVRTVVYERAPPVTATPIAARPSPPPVPDRWAVVIGVGQYQSPDIPRLPYAVRDAEAIGRTLVERAGFKREHMLFLTDTADKKPTLRNIKWALGTFLARSAKKEDTVLVFFAGHGAPELDPQGIERDGLAKYLVPADADADDLYSTALPMDEIQTIFGRIEAERVVVFVDACYSGAAGGRTFASSRVRTRDIRLDDQFLARLAHARGRAIVTASRPSEVSIELAELGHGLFTYYLVRGLQGAADLDGDGIVSLSEIYTYVEREVVRKSRAVGGSQHPVMKGELEGTLPLVRLR